MSDRQGVDGPARAGDGGISPHDPAAWSRLDALCPFLSSVDGDWRAAAPAREHRCSAVAPPAALSPDKQRRLCLVEAHTTCATFLAARRTLVPDEATSDPGDASGSTPSSEIGRPRPDRRGPREITRWAIPRTAPVVLDRGRPSLAAVMAHRSVTQLALVLLMALAFLILALARLSADDRRSSVVASPSAVAPAASAEATVLQTATVAASFRPSPAPSVGASAAVMPAASSAVSPSAQRAYRVVAGDTLSGIAARFGVTVHALQVANRIADPSRLRIGMVLVIP